MQIGGRLCRNSRVSVGFEFRTYVVLRTGMLTRMSPWFREMQLKESLGSPAVRFLCLTLHVLEIQCGTNSNPLSTPLRWTWPLVQ